jgi:uncharacterized protein YunC (DUF1805 family)
MVNMAPVWLGNMWAVAVTVELPGTRLVAVRTDVGYAMCGALDVRLLDERLGERQVIAVRAVGVRSVEELLRAPVDDLTRAAAALGIRRGMQVEEALRRMQPSGPQG